MRRRSDQTENWDELRDRIVGLGEQSSRKSYYPELKKRVRELEETRKSLAELNAFLQAVMDAATEVAIIATSPEGAITLFNRGAEKLLGYRAEEVIGKTTLLSFHLAAEVTCRAEELSAAYATSIGGFQAIIERAAREDSEKREWTYKRKDGCQVPVELVVTAIREDGQISGYLGIAQDISERKQSELAVRNSESRYRRLHESMRDAFVCFDMAGTITESNQAFQTMLGYTSDELGTMTYRTITPEAWHAKEWEIIRTQVLERGFSETYEKDYRRKDGALFPVELRTFLIRNDTGEPDGMWAIVRDITDRKRAEEELKEHRDHLEELVKERTAELTVAKEQAESANRAKSDFLSSMSHELRTPLNAILGYAQILKRQKNLTETQRQQLDTLRGSGEHLLALINDILDVGRIEARKMEIEEEPFNLSSLLWWVCDISKVESEEKELGFQYKAVTPLPEHVRGDERKLKQVLLNLLGNAVKYTRRGGVTLRVSYDKAGHGRFLCEVVDTGIGILPDKLEKIFEPFTQLASSRQVRGGTGLGLAITKELVTLMHGTLSVKSEVGTGSTFWFEVPLPEVVEVRAVEEKTEQLIVGDKGESESIREDVTFEAPPPEEMKKVYGLAKRGDLRGIQAWADRLEENDKRYTPFAAKLRELAGSYKPKAILALVEQHVQENGNAH